MPVWVAAVAYDRSNLIAVDFLGNQFGSGEVRSVFAAGGVAAVTEAALLDELRPSRIDQRRRKSLRVTDTRQNQKLSAKRRGKMNA